MSVLGLVLFRGLPPPQSAFRLVAGCSLRAVISRNTHRLSPAAALRAFDFEVLFLAEMRSVVTVLSASGTAPLLRFRPPLGSTHLPVPQPSRRSLKHPLMALSAFSVLLGRELARRSRSAAPLEVSSLPTHPFQSKPPKFATEAAAPGLWSGLIAFVSEFDSAEGHTSELQ